MKKMLLPLYICAAMLISFGVSAQNSPTYLGSASNLKSQLSLEAGNTAKTTSLTLSAGNQKELTVEVANQSGNSFIGTIQDKAQSDFFIQFNGNQVKGNIILRAEKLAYQIYSDASGNVYLEETDIHKVLCIENPVRPAQPSSARTQAATPSNVYNLQSLPGAAAVAYMDFDGEYVSGTYWNGGNPINAAPAGMTNDDIYLAWQITSEDYRAFNINITTDVNVFNAAPKGKRMHIIITPTWDAMPNSGGVAYIGSFTWTDEAPCWSFTTGVGTGGKNIGEVSSHELGHTLGLGHDGRDFPNGDHEEYYGGQSDWAPIMGVSYGAPLGQWSLGEYQYANNHENDLSVITSQNGFGYRSDDFGNTLSGAGALIVLSDGTVSGTVNNGIITSATDVDFFTFTTTGGAIQLDITPSEVYPDLDIKATLYDAQGGILTTSDLTGYNALFSLNLAPGTYYIGIDGTGAGDPFTNGYSDYSSIGYYSISGKINGNTQSFGPEVYLTAPANNSVFPAGSTIHITATATDIDGTVTKVAFYKNGTDLLFEDFTAPYSYDWVNVPEGMYSITAVGVDDALLSGSDRVNITVTSVNICGGTQPWSATTTYATPGQRVQYQGNIFENKWWTLNDTPNLNDPWGVWKYISACPSGNRAPVVTFTAPAKNSVFQEGTAITLTADAVDPDGSVSRVNFYNGASFSDYDDAAPFSIVKTLAPGSYVYSAIAIDNLGLQSDAATVNFIVNALPTASFILPHANDAYALGSTITISLNANDADGNITKIEFFLGGLGNKVGEDVSAPYSITYSPVPPATSAQGNYLPVIAKIYDNNGGIIVIDTYIQVTPATNICNSIPQYVQNGGYSAGSQVKNAGRKYECKPWPYSGWCNGASVAYAPGTGTNWTDAWIDLGSCTGNAPVVAGSSTSSTTALTVSPNPANSSIQVEYPQQGSATLRLTDAMGNPILSQEFNSGNSIDLSALPAGVYILQIRTEGEQYTQRVVKY